MITLEEDPVKPNSALKPRAKNLLLAQNQAQNQAQSTNLRVQGPVQRSDQADNMDKQGSGTESLYRGLHGEANLN